MTSIRVPAHARLLAAVLALFVAAPAEAARIRVELEGIDGDLRAVALASLELQQYANRDVSPAQARRLYRRAEEQIQSALEPYGYYNAKVDGELREEGADFVAVLRLAVGPPVKVSAVELEFEGDVAGIRSIDQARAAFAPRQNDALDHVAYERSKAAIHAALFSAGFLDARLAVHRVEVKRAENTARIQLKWQVGERYRFGETQFEGAQFPDRFLERYIPWSADDYYSQDEVLVLQQRLVDANYFSIAQVSPDTEKAADGHVPIAVMLAPAKRTVYTGGVFVGTDTGPGVRGGVERRWINARGHKLKFETILAQRLKTLSTLYQIPLPGPDNHSLNFGIAYRDENTDTSQSKTLRLAATDSRVWHGWTRTLGLQFLTGDFEVADQKGTTTLLYPEVSLTKKRADDPNFPRRGWSLTLAARAGQEGLLSDTSFAQVTADAKWIRGIGDDSRFIARGSVGYTRVDDFDKLPPELRFFAGGDRSIRGYAFQTVGPREVVPDHDDPQVIGGEQLVVASAEYEYYFSPRWGGAAFVDAGDAFSGSNFDLKIGAGFGLRWRSPVGLVRVDLGTPIGDDYASGVELHIIIGPDL
ncbi:MAG: outer membrane protein assembly factor [Xanthomonadales bacterium]|nr:outer membrane protein assembly factor [Xanthomonadales bacterium]